MKFDRYVNPLPMVTELATVAILSWVLVKGSGAIQPIVASILASVITYRVADRSRRGVGVGSLRPPSDGDGGMTVPVNDRTGFTNAPPTDHEEPYKRTALGFATLALIAVSCAQAGAPPVQVATYAARRTACVALYDAAADARACMKQVDKDYGQDGGL
jgi:hypothetical protein